MITKECKRKQEKARKRQGTPWKPPFRKCQRTGRAAKQGKARDSESKGEQGNVGKRKGNQAKPEKASDCFARGARSARLPGGKARES